MQIYRDLYPQHYSWSTGTLGSGMVPQGSAIRIVAFTFHFVRNIYYTLYSSVYHGAGLGPHSPVVVTLEWKNCIMYSLPCDVQYMSFLGGGGVILELFVLYLPYFWILVGVFLCSVSYSDNVQVLLVLFLYQGLWS